MDREHHSAGDVSSPTTDPVQRLSIVDSGASMHMMSKEDLTREEEVTARYSKQPTTVTTANRSMHTIEQATIDVKDLDMFVTV